MDNTKLEALIEEAIAHCYDEEEEFWAMFSALVGRVSFPLQASLRGEAVTLVGLDEPSSDVQRGMMGRIRKGDQEEVVALSELEVVESDPASAEWLAAYRHWVGRGG